MGGQVGDTAELSGAGKLWHIANTQKSGNTWLHVLGTANEDVVTLPDTGSAVTVSVNAPRRNAIQRHHTVTHLLHWALHEVVSKDATQKGSYVGPEKLTFDFNSAPLTPQQVADIVNYLASLKGVETPGGSVSAHETYERILHADRESQNWLTTKWKPRRSWSTAFCTRSRTAKSWRSMP